MTSLQNSFSGVLSQWMALPVILDNFDPEVFCFSFYKTKELTLFSSAERAENEESYFCDDFKLE